MIAFNDNCERRIDGLAIVHRMGSLGKRRTCASRNRQAKWSITCEASQPHQALLPCHRHKPPALIRITDKSHLISIFTTRLVLTKLANVLTQEIGERQRASPSLHSCTLTDSKQCEHLLHMRLLKSHSCSSSLPYCSSAFTDFILNPRKQIGKCIFPPSHPSY